MTMDHRMRIISLFLALATAKGTMPREEAIRLIHGYWACVSYIDALIGKVIRELERLNLRRETIIILWGDHGWKLGDYGAWCKHTNFELDTHVPMILRAPGHVRPGQRTEALVEYVDVFPTLAELCGLEIPASCEGTSLVPLLSDPKRPWKRAAFSQYPRGKAMGYSIRAGHWRYTEWIDRKTLKRVGRELYDHRESATAGRNLAVDPKYAETVDRLASLLAKGQGWQQVRDQLGRSSKGAKAE
jgi:iduronate 2-sulfatase